ncbi:MAG TPA: response regulator transcription factor [Clostridia bacterium]|nr:response regulator transcription factor [Clostridia bacterium]
MEPNNVNILVVEDDRSIRNFIHYTLSAEGFRYISSGTGQGALSMLVSEPVDLMLLDLGLPDCDGKEIIRTVREWSEIPIIIVSGRDQDKEKAAMLDLGADDYLTKPFSATELMARIRVALRHLYRQKNSNETQNVMQVAGLYIDPDKRLVYVDGREIHMTPMEYSLMTLFFRNIGKVLTTKNIINEIWGVGYGNDTQALRTLMAGLRRKIEINPAKPRYILTEMGVGYRLTDE